MKENLAFRLWYYFRQGWSIYFAFIFAAINTLTVTYYLAIEKAPMLKDLIPSFITYVAVVVVIGAPILVMVGYLHTKKSAAFKAEADIGFEVHPHFRRMLNNTEEILKQQLQINEILAKISKGEKLTQDDANRISTMQKDLGVYMQQKTFDDKTR